MEFINNYKNGEQSKLVYKDTTILLVDGDFGHADLVKRNFRSKSLTNNIMHFSNSFTILKHLFEPEAENQNSHYLILIDINMPGLDSDRMLKKLGSYDHTQNIPIILLSDTEHAHAERSNTACLSKPLRFLEFEKSLESLGLLIKTANIPCMKRLVSVVS